MKDFVLDQPTSNFIKIRRLDCYMVGHKGYIAGGVFKNIFNDERFKDVDIFFEKKEDFVEADLIFSNDDDYVKRYENKKCKAYLNLKTNVTVELIRHQFASPLEMTRDFDFTITKFVYYKEVLPTDQFAADLGIDEDSVVWKIAYHDKFFEHLLLKRLVIDRNADELILPVNSFNRMFRYAKYGYFPCRETKTKIIEALRKLPNFSEDLLTLELYNGMD